ncbi:alanine racemase [Bacillus horti]|uniref:Alanine racemase n=1 Tax=Caldalkalibacillus horti TaxID=77523 RepID=A0ABT9W4T4_9BACI|nr:alanine racemase [Bacillus horti]MDQ0168251.1 alanine racemase [Bacillus horti]
MQTRGLYRKTWAEIDLGAIAHNVSFYREHISQDKELMAVVKANGYGHGAVPVAKEALAAGATWLGVALLEEALEIREAGIDAPILQFGYCAEEGVPIAQKYRITISFNDVEALQRALPYIDQDAPELLFHLKLDTGMGRMGLSGEGELNRFISDYQQAKNKKVNVKWQGVYTHFATADEHDLSYTNNQQKIFQDYLALVKKANILVPYIHDANSAATAIFPEIVTTNLVRVGISMYGLHPSMGMKESFPFPLKPALSLHTRLSHVKQAKEGAGISYGVTYKTEQESWIGTLPIGYADGWSRGLSNQSYALIQGRRVKQVGRICMDQCMLLLDQYYPRDEKVTLIGRQGDQEISIDEVAQLLGTINYEISCRLHPRVPRIYYKYGERLPF